jgi:hypothetical protein
MVNIEPKLNNGLVPATDLDERQPIQLYFVVHRGLASQALLIETDNYFFWGLLGLAQLEA